MSAGRLGASADLRPRQYAARILEIPAHERAAALGLVPPHLRPWVAEYVGDPHAEQRIVNSVAASIARITGRENRVKALGKVPAMFRDRVKAAAIAMIEKRREASRAG